MLSLIARQVSQTAALRAAPVFGNSAAAAFSSAGPSQEEIKKMAADFQKPPAHVNDGEFPSSESSSVGLEREEYKAHTLGVSLFDLDPIVAPFGTAEAPVKVESLMAERIVGCEGGAGSAHHEVQWLNLEKGAQTSCAECGQVFALVDPAYNPNK